MFLENTKLYVKLRVPDGRMVALVVMVHGIGEHGGCYDEWAEKFVAQSIGFLTFDLRGHGLSPGIRGHASINILKNDLRKVINEVRKKYTGIPIILFGHSMGGQVVLSHAFDETVMVDGVVASSPMLKLVNPPSKLVYLARWASKITPWITLKTGIKAEQLSHTDAEKRKSTKKDPLLQKRISIKLFSDMYANGDMIVRSDNLSSDIPILLMHGSDDKIVSFEANEQFAKKNQKIIDFKQWQNMYHDLLFDTGKEKVFEYVLQWLSKNILEKWNYSEQ